MDEFLRRSPLALVASSMVRPSPGVGVFDVVQVVCRVDEHAGHRCADHARVDVGAFSVEGGSAAHSVATAPPEYPSIATRKRLHRVRIQAPPTASTFSNARRIRSVSCGSSRQGETAASRPSS